MKHKIIPIMAAVMWGLSLFALPAQARYGGGSGTAEDPYLIFDANQMNAVGADSNDWDKHFLLCADIDFSAYTETAFNIIGTGYFECPPIWFCYLVSTPFTGTFDGNNHKISNFTYISTETDSIDFIGIFGVVDGVNAKIQNLGLISADVDVGNGNYVGSLVGYLRDGTITNCYAGGGSVTGNYRVGGLAGSIVGTITNCYATGSVTGEDYVGGLVGTNSGTISNCYSRVYVVGHYDVGGLAGYNYGTISDCNSDGDILGVSGLGGLVGDNKGRINDCFSTASVRGDRSSVGGLVGSNSGTVCNCYAKGNVSGDRYVGGLVGYTAIGIITNCYSACDVDGNDFVGGLVGNNCRRVVNCYSTGSVSGTTNVGGLVGVNGSQRRSGTITNCYSAAAVTGTTSIGGLVGINVNGATAFSFWDVNTSGLACSDGGEGKTTTEMQRQSTFTDVGWDFAGEYENGPSDDWAEPLSGGYMVLWWQPSPLPELPTFSGGTGEPNNPYLILTAAELNHIGHNQRLMGRHFRLINDIDLTGTEFFIIGNNVFPFTGTFDGNDKTVSNFIYRSTNQDETGFFTYVNSVQSQIKDLYLKDSCIEAETDDKVGTLVGELAEGTISDCHVELCTISGKRYVGGLVGFNRNGTILNCTSSGSVSGGGQGSFLGSGYVGGLVGSNSGIIYNCTSASSIISGNDDAVGGLVGRHTHISRSDFEIRDCYTTGLVSANRWVGGLVGDNMGPIRNCGSSSSVLGNNEVGGLVGFNNSRIKNCYSIGNISGITYVGGLAGRNRYKISNCYSVGGVTGATDVGGLVGWNYRGTISDCFSTSTVIRSNYVGGLVGTNEGGTITNCYASGSVSGQYRVGGLVGFNHGFCSPGGGCSGGMISNCYSTGKVAGATDVGGLVGKNWGNVAASFWDIETSGNTWSSGGTGKTTAEMQMQVTFTDTGWDFVGETFNGIEDIWFIPQHDYPHLWWEGMKVSMKLTPRTLNCRSKGNWVKAHLTLPQGFTIADVNSDRPAVLHSFGFESAPLYVFVNENELVEIEAAFEREAVCSLAGDWPQELTVAGFLTDGNIFLGTSTVRIIHPGLKVIEELASCWLQGDCVHPTWCDRIDMNRDSLVNLLDYALLMNINVEFVSE